MAQLYTITGKIIKSKSLKNNTFWYWIEDTKGNTEKYTYFAHDKGGMDTFHFVTIKYVKVTNNFGTSNIVKEIKYGAFVTDYKIITDFLINTAKLPKKAVMDIVSKFKENTLDVVFNEPHKIANLNTKLIDSLKQRHDKIIFSMELAKINIPIRYHDEIINRYGSEMSKIKEHFYDFYLVFGMPFRRCDNLAMMFGYNKNDERRIKAFLIFVYKELNNAGKVYETFDNIRNKCTEYEIKMDNVIQHLIKIGEHYTIEKICDREKQIERVCRELAYVKTRYKEIKHFDEELNEHQKIAIRNALENNISIVTGGPGTGKSYIIGKIIKILNKNSLIHVLAPTGAAVERLRNEKYVSKYNLKMRTLQSFVYNNNSKGQHVAEELDIVDMYEFYEEFIFFIDEMSMVDMHLFHKFLKIISKIIDKVRLIVLGDRDQLPSIKGGNVLRDLIDSREIKCTFLRAKYRQKNDDIVHNAKLVLEGKDLNPDGQSVKFIQADNKKEIEKTLIEVIKNFEIRYENSCVLIPTRKKNICVDTINPILQDYYNPINELNTGVFRIGDKIMHGKNNKDKDVYNGSILVVDSIDGNKDNYIMKCEYYSSETIGIGESKTVIYRRKNQSGSNEILDNKVDLAYAMTIHKAQGKGYDTVIIIIHSSMYHQLLNRNLLYTAITRAKERCIIIGDEEGLLECKKMMEPRITNLFRCRPIIEDLLYINNHIDQFKNNSAIRNCLKKLDIKSNKWPNLKLQMMLLQDQDLMKFIIEEIRKIYC